MVIKKLEIEVKEVSWTNGTPNKFQAFASFTHPGTGKVERRIISDPEPTEKKAMDSLKNEAEEWNMVSAQLLDELSKIKGK